VALERFHSASLQIVWANDWVAAGHNQLLVRKFYCFDGLLTGNERLHYDVFLEVHYSDHFVPACSVHELVGEVYFGRINGVSELKDIDAAAVSSLPLSDGTVISTTVNESACLVKTVDSIGMTYHWKPEFFGTNIPTAYDPIFIPKESLSVAEIKTCNERMLFFGREAS